MAERAQQKPESRRRFALALAGMDDEEAFLGYRLGRYLGVLRGLALFHFLPVAKRFGAVFQFSCRNIDHVGLRSLREVSPIIMPARPFGTAIQSKVLSICFFS